MPADGRRQGNVLRMSPFVLGFTGTLGAMIAVGLAGAVIQAQSVVILIVTALFIALGLNPAVELLVRRGLPRPWSVALIFLGVLAVLALAIFAIVPVFTSQIGRLSSTTPDFLLSLRRNEQISELDRRFGIIERASDFLTSQELISWLFGGVLGAGRVVVNVVFSGFTLLILTIYFLSSLPSLTSALLQLSPASRRGRVAAITGQIFDQIGAYLSTKFLIALIVGAATYPFLWLVGLGEFALALAVMVAILDFIPMVGQVIAAVIVSAIAFFSSLGAGIATVVFFGVYIQVENYLLQPRLMRRSIEVPAVVTITAALVGAALWGVVGALLAIPVAAALLLLLREVVQPRLDAQ